MKIEKPVDHHLNLVYRTPQVDGVLMQKIIHKS